MTLNLRLDCKNDISEQFLHSQRSSIRSTRPSTNHISRPVTREHVQRVSNVSHSAPVWLKPPCAPKLPHLEPIRLREPNHRLTDSSEGIALLHSKLEIVAESKRRRSAFLNEMRDPRNVMSFSPYFAKQRVSEKDSLWIYYDMLPDDFDVRMLSN